MSATTSTTFDLERLTRATEERDASTQLSMYAPDAIVTIADRTAPPSAPRVLNGVEAIKGWIEDLTGRDMTHRVGHTVHDADGAAYVVSCRYPDGAQVLCSTVIELAGGQIVKQSVLQVWDEA
ncbi:MAG: nuclear transport factor 2 family protein [Solirubrobacteraceae bacterium]